MDLFAEDEKQEVQKFLLKLSCNYEAPGHGHFRVTKLTFSLFISLYISINCMEGRKEVLRIHRRIEGFWNSWHAAVIIRIV